MDENFVERLRFIRERMAVSGRKLSLELGLNVNAWASYENGGSLPGSAVLNALCKRGVNLNWLMTGEGEPWWKSDDESTEIATYIKKQDNLMYRQLGLGKLAMVASRANNAERFLVVKALVASGPLCLSELAANISLSEPVLVSLLIELIEENLVEEVQQDGLTRYRAKIDSYWKLERSKSDIAQLTLDAVEMLVKDVYPGALTTPSSAVLVRGTAYLKNGRAWLDSIVEQIQDASAQKMEPGSDSVTLVLGAALVNS